MSEYIFGLTWEEIQLAQQGKEFRKPLPTTPPNKPTAKQSDIDLLEKHGKQGLNDLKFYGVIDRLTTSNLI